MELFKYIVKFIYRIRWWMVIFPCIAGIIAWFLTRSLEKTYDVKTTIFTGIISGYNVDATDTRNATVHMSNLMNINYDGTHTENSISETACPLFGLWRCRKKHQLYFSHTLPAASFRHSTRVTGIDRQAKRRENLS